MTTQTDPTLARFTSVDCPTNGCDRCVEMCSNKPCWGSPEDARRLIEAGYGDRLMIDWWAEGKGNTHVLSPAIVGHEGSPALFFLFGGCTFLTAEGKCELHNLGLKPWEGRVSDCQQEKEQRVGDLGIHEAVARTWMNDEAQLLVRQYRHQYCDTDTYTDVDLQESPKT